MLESLMKVLGLRGRRNGLDGKESEPPAGPGRAERWKAGGPRRRPTRRAAGAPSELPPRSEQACRLCSTPLLPEWGGNCPKCRLTLAVPSAAYDDGSGLVAAPSMTLGWLVVLRSADESQAGRLLELTEPTAILTREGSIADAASQVHQFQDAAMSFRHALIRRPSSSARDAAFTLADRSDPPSVNGTFLNSRKLPPNEAAALRDGDFIRLGTTSVLFKSLWLPPSGRYG